MNQISKKPRRSKKIFYLRLFFTAKTDEEGKELLRMLGMPFKK